MCCNGTLESILKCVRKLWICLDHCLVFWETSLFTRACWKYSRTRDRAAQTSFAAHHRIHSGSHNLFPSPARFLSLKTNRSLEDFRQNRERQPRSWKSQFIIEWLEKVMTFRDRLLRFFRSLYIFKEISKQERAARKVQFMVLMHSESYKLLQWFELSCCVLSSSRVCCPSCSVMSSPQSFVLCPRSPSRSVPLSPSNICVCVWRSFRCLWATRRSETTKVAPVSLCFLCLHRWFLGYSM